MGSCKKEAGADAVENGVDVEAGPEIPEELGAKFTLEGV